MPDTQRRRRRLPGALSVALLLAPAIASADEKDATSAEHTQAAREHAKKGIALAENQRHEAAAAEFEKSLSLRESAVVQFNLASVRAELGHNAEADRLLRQLIADQEVSDRVKGPARELLQSLQPKLAQLTIHVMGPRESLGVTVNDRALEPQALGTAVRVDPGAQVIQATRDGRPVWRRTIEVAAGEAQEVTLQVAPSPRHVATGSAADSSGRLHSGPDARAAADPATHESVLRSGWFWAGAGAALMAIVVTSVVLTRADGATVNSDVMALEP